jgi:hypothetical protein
MTAGSAPAVAVVAAAPSARAGVRALGRVEALRLTRHPLVVGALLVAVVIQVNGLSVVNDYETFNTLTLYATVVVGPLTFFAANLAASRDRRALAGEWTSVLPLGSRARIAALCLGVLGPVLATIAMSAGLQAVYRFAGAEMVRYPDPGEFLIGPLTVLGGGLLGIMVALWAPWRGAAGLVMIALGVLTLGLGGAGRFEWLAPFLELTVSEDDRYIAFKPGSATWHAAYLVCLSGMAAVGALLRPPAGRRRLLLAGAAFTAGAIICGWLQLP